MKNAKGKGAVKNSKETLRPVDDRMLGKRKASYKSDKSSARKPKKAKKDPNQPKRPHSAFFVFLEEFRRSFTKENPEQKGVITVAKAGGAKWKSLTNAEKAPYEAKAAKMRAEYIKFMIAYNTKKANLADDAGEMENLFKDTVAAGNGAWTPSQGDEYEGTEDLTTDPSSVAHRKYERFNRVIESLNSETTVTSGTSSNVPTLGVCLDMLKQLPGLQYGGETHILGIRLMQSKSNREIFVLLNDDPVLQLKWIKSHTLADVSCH